jgi:hypothetical protein
MPTPCSAEYHALKRECDRLERIYLDPYKDYDGRRVSTHRTSAAAFRVLACAAIEYYLEVRCEEVALRKFAAWRTSTPRVPSLTIIGLLAFSGREHKDADESVSTASTQLVTCVERAKNVYIAFVKTKNHGIREKNLSLLLLPLGIEASAIDPLWLIEMDQFGKDRGDVAHKPSSIYAALTVDVAVIKARLRGIQSGLRELDRHLSGL